LPNIFGRDDSSVDFMGGISIDSVALAHQHPSVNFRTRNHSLLYDYNTQLGGSLLSRHRRNQRTLDRIVNPDQKLKTELNRIRRDISDNILSYHKPAF
jgi:hypothetical protein